MKVGIIGAGTMGSGIAQAFAQTEGYEVYLCDINEEFAANGKNKIAKGLQRLVTKGKKTQEDVDAILAKITTGVKDICTDCDLMVKVAQSGGLCYTCVMGTWKSKNRHSKNCRIS